MNTKLEEKFGLKTTAQQVLGWAGGKAHKALDLFLKLALVTAQASEFNPYGEALLAQRITRENYGSNISRSEYSQR